MSNRSGLCRIGEVAVGLKKSGPARNSRVENAGGRGFQPSRRRLRSTVNFLAGMFGGRLSAEVSKGIELLLSMTGFGEAKRQSGELTVAVEIRTVNNRYLKVQSRLADVYARWRGRSNAWCGNGSVVVR